MTNPLHATCNKTRHISMPLLYPSRTYSIYIHTHVCMYVCKHLQRSRPPRSHPHTTPRTAFPSPNSTPEVALPRSENIHEACTYFQARRPHSCPTPPPDRQVHTCSTYACTALSLPPPTHVLPTLGRYLTARRTESSLQHRLDLPCLTC